MDETLIVISPIIEGYAAGEGALRSLRYVCYFGDINTKIEPQMHLICPQSQGC